MKIPNNEIWHYACMECTKVYQQWIPTFSAVVFHMDIDLSILIFCSTEWRYSSTIIASPTVHVSITNPPGHICLRSNVRQGQTAVIWIMLDVCTGHLLLCVLDGDGFLADAENIAILARECQLGVWGTGVYTSCFCIPTSCNATLNFGVNILLYVL